MKTKIRETISGTEYWDSSSKKTLFVAKGEEPNFKITDNPKTMIDNSEEKRLVVKTLESTDKDVEKTDDTETIYDEKKSLDNTNQEKDVDDEDSKQGYINDDGDLVEFQTMTFKDLKKYADENDITVSSTIKTKAQIIELIVAAEDDE
ncbi:MAG: hypothetical protein EOM50_11540 [Erysipelotrichia bacterium]|nr:hypothetical protein [Erysipelotrichia bacterium]